MFRVLLIVLVVPIIGFGISSWIIIDVNSELARENLPSIQAICAFEDLSIDSEVQAACEEFDAIALLRSSSIIAGLLGIAIPGLFWFGSLLAGSNRSRLAAIFPTLTRLVVLLLSILVILQGGILTYGVYVGESYAIGRVHFVLIGVIGLGAIFAAIALVRAAFGLGKKLQTTVTGIALSATDAPGFYHFVDGLASKLDASTPKNIVVGLDPNFFVTSADVNCLVNHKQLTGETLFVSAPLSRLLTKDELAAVIGHELGHFRGEDTVYSMKFAPVYSGMAAAIGAMDVAEDEGASGLAKIPALAVLSYMHEVFSRNERTIGRARELHADQAGVEASSGRSLAAALAKISFYSGIWLSTQNENINRLSEGKITRNLSAIFCDSAKYDIEHMRFDEIIDSIMENKIAHPTDTHPTFGERLNGLGLSKEDLHNSDFFPPDLSAIELLDNSKEIEEHLTLFEHRLRVALGQVVIPKESEKNHFLNVIYMMTAAMVSADGRLDPDEIVVAEAIGQNLIVDFDSVDFREACKRDDLPAFGGLVDLLKDVLNQEMKDLIYKYLEQVAKADGAISPEEQDLLKVLSNGFGVVSA